MDIIMSVVENMSYIYIQYSNQNPTMNQSMFKMQRMEQNQKNLIWICFLLIPSRLAWLPVQRDTQPRYYYWILHGAFTEWDGLVGREGGDRAAIAPPRGQKEILAFFLFAGLLLCMCTKFSDYTAEKKHIFLLYSVFCNIILIFCSGVILFRK